MNQAPKGNRVKVSTFRSWGKEDILGFKTEEKDGVIYVVYIWCKICARNSNAILNHPKCTGEAKKSMKAFIDGTNGVTKHSVDRHLKGKVHELALMLENEKPAAERMDIERTQQASISRIQPTIPSCVQKSTREAYGKLIRTAYELAKTPSMPLSHFSVLVKCQRQNRVRLIEGKQNGKAAREFISCIATAITEKVAVILAGSDFISILSDGSQARKTKSEKELILTRVERAGIPCYFVTSLIEMANFGGTDADSIKKSIDHVYKNEMRLPDDIFEKHVVSATSDGARVNTGIYRGVLTQLKNERPWLTTIHCVNHRVELALKDVMARQLFKDAEHLYESTYKLLKRSGALKAAVQQAAEVIGITHYELSKIHGTRFVSHREKGYKRFLHLLPALVMAFENYEVQVKNADTKAKVSELLKKFRSTKIFNMCAALDIFGKLQPASLVFEGEGLMAYEIYPSIEMTINDLQDMVDSDEKVETDSMLRFFQFHVGSDGKMVATHEYCKAGHEKRNPQNREYHTVKIDKMIGWHGQCIENFGEKLRAVASDLIEVLNERFADFRNLVFCSMKWLDPQFWLPSLDFGNDQLLSLYNHFKVPLDKASYDASKVEKEWKQVRSFITSHFLKSEPPLTAAKIWQNILRYRREEFPNICKVVSLILAMSGSNSTVERAFSMLTLMLSDRRLCLKHAVINDIMVIKGNDKTWSSEEREQLMERALDIYLSKRRTKKVSNLEPPQKTMCLDIEIDNSSSDDESYLSSSSNDEI